MSYIDAYKKVFSSAMFFFAIVYLGIGGYKMEPLALYLVYLATIVGLAGPMAVFFNKKKL